MKSIGNNRNTHTRQDIEKEQETRKYERLLEVIA